MSASATPPAEIVEPPQTSRTAQAIETLAILAVFAFFAAWPVPDVNEAHYLFKARHYVDPSFLQGDFFLESAEAHSTFYKLFGWLTQAWSFETAAWCGRILSWSLLAIAWQRLSWSVLPRGGLSVLGAALYVTLCERTHMAGEWVVGGFESKPLAYACVFFGLAEIVRQRWNRGLAWIGLATFLHVLVGGWSLIAIGVCWWWQDSERPRLSSLLLGLAAATILAACGALPAVQMNHGVDPAIVGEAHRIYVFERLAHHLTPFSFKLELIERHALLFCVWVALCVFTGSSREQRLVRVFVAGAMLISLGGLILAVLLRNDPVFAASWLRFYWFRLGDVILPLGVTLVGLSFLFVSFPGSRRLRFVLLCGVALFISWHAIRTLDARRQLVLSRSDPPTKVIDALDWLSACLWIRAETPSDAVVLAPRSAQTFKWHARRAEVGNWKDIPQNARDIVEWRTRMDAIHATHSNDPEDRWYDSLAEAGVDHTLQMGRRYGADFVLTAADPPLALPVRYRNNSYVVYELPSSTAP